MRKNTSNLLSFVKEASPLPEKRPFLLCEYADLPGAFTQHFHNVYEMIYVEAGAIEIKIQDKAYAAGPGSLIFLNKLEEHSLTVRAGPYRRYFAQFSPEDLEHLLPEPKLRAVFINRPGGFRPIFDLSSVSGQAQALCAGLLAEYQSPAPPDKMGRLYSSALLTQLLILCYRLHSALFPLPNHPVNHAVFEIRRYIEHHFTEELSITALAQEYFLSPCYLSHCFQEWIGCSPKQYVMRSRISSAKELLLHTALTVEEVAQRCGFSDANNFIRSFKRECRVTPGQYRRRLTTIPSSEQGGTFI